VQERVASYDAILGIVPKAHTVNMLEVTCPIDRPRGVRLGEQTLDERRDLDNAGRGLWMSGHPIRHATSIRALTNPTEGRQHVCHPLRVPTPFGGVFGTQTVGLHLVVTTETRGSSRQTGPRPGTHDFRGRSRLFSYSHLFKP
jgi:hypothetical protein